MKAISDWLELYRTKFSLPLPEDNVDIKANGTVIAYQWYAWANVLESIEFSNGWKDPKNDIYYSYYLTKDKKYFQLMWFLEEEDNLQTNIFNQIGAVDYSILIPTVYWNKLGILTDELNTPVQEVSSIISAWKIELGTTNSWTVFSAHINDWRTYTFTWYILNHKLYTLNLPWTYSPPKDCPDWFIWAWWDSAFNQVWFCVAKYEMTYEDADTPDSTWDWEDWNTMHYVDWKTIVSMYGKYAIADINQIQAISACKSMWDWYHLITNNEWMSIARNIELEAENWSTLEVWNWHISNWVSNDTTLGCDKTWWNIEPRAYATKTWEIWTSNCTVKKHKLSNNLYIWNLAWNVWEHVNKGNTIDGSNFNNWVIAFWVSNVEWKDWTNVNIDSIEKNNYGPLVANDALNGIWRIFDMDWTSPSNVFIRGGSASREDNWGIFALSLRRNSVFMNRRAGFRCAYIK